MWRAFKIENLRRWICAGLGAEVARREKEEGAPGPPSSVPAKTSRIRWDKDPAASFHQGVVGKTDQEIAATVGPLTLWARHTKSVDFAGTANEVIYEWWDWGVFANEKTAYAEGSDPIANGTSWASIDQAKQLAEALARVLEPEAAELGIGGLR